MCIALSICIRTYHTSVDRRAKAAVASLGAMAVVALLRKYQSKAARDRPQIFDMACLVTKCVSSHFKLGFCRGFGDRLINVNQC